MHIGLLMAREARFRLPPLPLPLGLFGSNESMKQGSNESRRASVNNYETIRSTVFGHLSFQNVNIL